MAVILAAWQREFRRSTKGYRIIAVNKAEKIDVENVNHPGELKQVDAEFYKAMKKAYLKILPKASPGLTLTEIQERLRPHLPEELFPNGAKAGWWAKTVQLDLEAKGIVLREKSKPLRLRLES